MGGAFGRLVPWLILTSWLGACGGRATENADGEGEAGRGATNVAGGVAAGGCTAAAGCAAGGGTAGDGTASSGTAASGTAGAAGAAPEPSHVTLIDPAGNVEGVAEPSVIGSCFHGFITTLGSMKIILDAFVPVPGDYRGDSIYLVMVSAYTNGREYHAGVSSAPFSETNLHVTSVSPRFVGHIDAKLYDSEDKDGVGPPLELSLIFDVASPPDTCGVPPP